MENRSYISLNVLNGNWKSNEDFDEFVRRHLEYLALGYLAFDEKNREISTKDTKGLLPDARLLAKIKRKITKVASQAIPVLEELIALEGKANSIYGFIADPNEIPNDLALKEVTEYLYKEPHSRIWCGLLKKGLPYTHELAVLDHLIQMNPNNAEALYRRARRSAELGAPDTENILALFKKALHIDIECSDDYWMGLGDFLLKYRLHKDAVVFYADLLRHCRPKSKNWFLSGYCLGEYKYIDDYAEAAQAYGHFLNTPDNFLSKWTKKAATILNKILIEELYPEVAETPDWGEYDPHFQDPQYWYSRAKIFSILGNKEQALTNLEAAIGYDSTYRDRAITDICFRGFEDITKLLP